MKILVITTLYPTSPETRRTTTSFAVHNFVKYWNRNHEIIVIKVDSFGIKQFFRWNNYTEEYTVEEVLVKNIPLCTVHFLNTNSTGISAFYLNKYLKAKHFVPNVIVSHCSSSHLIAMKMRLKYFEVPHVCGIHKADVSKLLKYEKDYQDCFYKADMLAFRSKPIKEKFFKNFNCDTNRHVCITTNSGIENKFIENSDFVLKKIKRQEKNIKIATIGALIPLKKIELVINALKNVTTTIWKYYVVGDGPERQRLEEISGDMLDKQIEFTGYIDRPEIEKLLKDIDVFVLVSERETFGLVYLEAMAKGCLVVGSRGWGIDGIIENGKNGFLCEPNNQEQLVAILEKIMNMTEDEFGKIVTAGYRSVINLEEEKVALEYLNKIVQITHTTGT